MLTLNDFKSALVNTSADKLVTLNMDGKDYQATAGDFQTIFGLGKTGKVKPSDGLTIRERPTIKSNKLYVLKKGDTVFLLSPNTVQADGYTWLNIKFQGYVGWVASNFIDITEVPPTPTPSGNFKFGFHVYPYQPSDNPGNGELFNTAQYLFNSKRPMSFTIVGDWAFANKIAPVSKLVVFRPYITERVEIDNDVEKAIRQGWIFADNHKDSFASLDVRDNIYIQYLNEGDNVDTKHINYGAFNLGIMQRLEGLGRKAVIFNDSVGTPEVNDIKNRDAAIQNAFKNGHLIGIHCYGAPDKDLSDPDKDNQTYYSLRYKMLYADYIKTNKCPKIVITECGRFYANFISVENIVNDMKKYHDMVVNDDNVIMFAWWQYNGKGTPDWDKSAFNVALVPIQNMIMSV